MREIDEIMHSAYSWKCGKVLATIVKTEGSSYRKAGAAMLISEHGEGVGAVSGGCIEQEVIRRSKEVFQSGLPMIIEYDGRYKLGCNGTLYILIEPFIIERESEVWQHYFQAFKTRKSWELVTSFSETSKGTIVGLGNQYFKLRPDFEKPEENGPETFVNTIQPGKQIYIFGNERDAYKLATIATEVGYQVSLISHPKNPIPVNKSLGFKTLNIAPEDLLNEVDVDEHTAVVLMSHSYSRDLTYLMELCRLPQVNYLGLLGPRRRKEELLNDVVEKTGDLPLWIDDALRGPVGLDIGGRLPSEIAVSIMAEIQSVFYNSSGIALTNKAGTIHERPSAAEA